MICFLSTTSQIDPPYKPSTGLAHKFDMSQKIDLKVQVQSIEWTKKVLLGIGSVFVVIGIIRQWPILGKTYMEFIEGKGYLALMLGLIMIVLGFSAPLLLGDEEDS